MEFTGPNDTSLYRTVLTFKFIASLTLPKLPLCLLDELTGDFLIFSLSGESIRYNGNTFPHNDLPCVLSSGNRLWNLALADRQFENPKLKYTLQQMESGGGRSSETHTHPSLKLGSAIHLLSDPGLPALNAYELHVTICKIRVQHVPVE